MSKDVAIWPYSDPDQNKRQNNMRPLDVQLIKNVATRLQMATERGKRWRSL